MPPGEHLPLDVRVVVQEKLVEHLRARAAALKTRAAADELRREQELLRALVDGLPPSLTTDEGQLRSA